MRYCLLIVASLALAGCSGPEGAALVGAIGAAADPTYQQPQMPQRTICRPGIMGEIRCTTY